MTIAERDACKVPKDEHKAPFLVVHIPEIRVSNFCANVEYCAYHVVTIDSSAFEHAFA